MTDTTLPGLLLTGDHASRPAASAVGGGTLYACSTHSLIYQSDTSTWSTWSDVSGSGLTNPMTTQGDIIYSSDGSGTPARLAASTSGYVLTTNGAGTNPTWTAAAGGGNYVLLTDTLLGSDTASFDFTSISGSYKHLVIHFLGRSDRASNAGDAVKMTFNNDGGSNYDYATIQFDGSTSYSGQAQGASSFASVFECTAATAPSGAAGAGTISIPNYAGTAFNKSYIADATTHLGNSSGDHRTWKTGGQWRSTAAITRITISPVNGTNFLTGSRASLYGIS